MPTETIPTRTLLSTASTNTPTPHIYTTMSLIMAIGVFAGFSRTYFAKTIFHAPPIPFWLHVHGAVFTAWILFYVLQNLLALYGGMRLHRALGLTGAILASAVIVLGLVAAIRQAHQGRTFPFPDTYSLLAVSAAQMLLFGLFIALALILKHDPETHKRLILMSTQLFFFPAFGRLFHGLNPTTLAMALALFLAGPAYDLIARRSIHPAYKAGVPLLILTTPPFMVIASHAPLWRHLVDLL